LKKSAFILFFILLAGVVCELHAQSGGRKKEHRNQKKGGSMFGKTKSQGNADAFARGGMNRKKSKRTSENLWVYKKSTLQGKQKKEHRFLFFRYRTKGKRYRDGILAKQNADRAKKRIRGNKIFTNRKY